ncbi:16S rRNA (adenine1518-N6/adenine1519-N6)-dimethyltransferase [Persephonella hydrogeniphila]|uniref:Ribosomal RNA small subunit methyltransferase A n=1 Tax=Persephonella hydrogeniphila TaxID=198703 RepID=A0A285NPI8_9AQUI|nr:16S rRNA (adenine(1518)-N(6)/adenine(1519)-N(6))-dimethyltransferase RsmA [Persephonella hydrogeniphila]SNZ11432.1 16S rRNA (adenine1518-N6/adenine1519-N6)-dimethyltransferase [Persephonella hydrogeniphila]
MKDRFKTKKKFGQHLLIASGIIQKIVDFMDINGSDIVIEIGVGTGQLTEEILKRKPKKLYGIEIDPQTYPIIKEKFGNIPYFSLIEKDFFDVNLRELSEGKKIKIVGNLPYNVASLILVNMPFYIDIIELTVFMLQKEVAEKLIAKPKTKQYTFLSVFIQTYFDVEYLMSVPARFFKPPPKVTSAVVRMKPKKQIPDFDKKGYKNFVSSLFSSRRKMLRTKIGIEILRKAGIKPELRAEELEVEDFIKLYSEYLLSKHDSKG